MQDPDDINVIAWAAGEGIAPGTYGVNLTQEIMIFPADYTIGMYKMIPIGKTEGKWVDYSKKPLNNKVLSGLLSKGGTLSVTEAVYAKTEPSETDIVVTFPTITARPKLAKLAVNYTLEASMVTDSLGDWTIAEIGTDKKHKVPTKQLVAAQPTNGKKLTIAELEAGSFIAFTPQPVLAADKKADAKANVWFVKENAMKNADGTYTPATKMKKFAGKSASKAPAFKSADVTAAAAGSLKVKKNWLYTTDGAYSEVNSTEDSKKPITSAGTYIFWTAPSEKKPPSERSSPITVTVSTPGT